MTDIYAHRGLHLLQRENTVDAFLEAKAIGVAGVELDVRRSRDGALVVHHDPAIDDVGPINECLMRDLPKYVPTLADALLSCEGIRVNVEIKNIPDEPGYDASGAFAHQVIDEIIDLGWRDSVIISSFDLATCEAVRQKDASIDIGWLLDWRRETAPTVDIVAQRGLNAIHPFFQRLDPTIVENAHARGIAVNVWTVNGASDMDLMFAWGVDTLITDDPALAASRWAQRPLG